MIGGLSRLFSLNPDIPSMPPAELDSTRPGVPQLDPSGSIGYLNEGVDWNYGLKGKVSDLRTQRIVIARRGSKTVSRTPSPLQNASCSPEGTSPPTVIMTEFKEEAYKDFYNESNAFHLVRQIPGVAQALHIDSEDRLIVQEDCGYTLKDWRMVRYQGEKLLVLYKLSETVQALHAKLLAHQDLKLENIGVPASESPMIFDLGTLVKGEEINLGTFKGTPAYYPPCGSKFDVRSNPQQHDVYSLGVVMYEVLTNQSWLSLLINELKVNVGTGDDIFMALLAKTEQRHIDAILGRAKEMDPKIKDFLRNMLILVPQERWTMVQVAEKMREIVESTPITPRAPLTKKNKPSFEERIGTAV